MGGELDVLVPPLGSPVVAGDERHPVQAAEVAIDKRVPCLRPVGGAIDEPQVPPGIFAPLMRLQEGGLLARMMQMPAG